MDFAKELACCLGPIPSVGPNLEEEGCFKAWNITGGLMGGDLK